MLVYLHTLCDNRIHRVHISLCWHPHVSDLLAAGTRLVRLSRLLAEQIHHKPHRITISQHGFSWSAFFNLESSPHVNRIAMGIPRVFCWGSSVKFHIWKVNTRCSNININLESIISQHSCSPGYVLWAVVSVFTWTWLLHRSCHKFCIYTDCIQPFLRIAITFTSFAINKMNRWHARKKLSPSALMTTIWLLH